MNLAGGSAGGSGVQMAVDDSGYMFITGVFNKSGIFGNDTLTVTVGSSDCFLAKYRNNGELIWVTHLNTSAGANGDGVVADGSGGVYLTGRFLGTVIFGNDTSTAWSEYIYFLR